MSPYPESRASYSSVHIDSGDDEDIENVETQAIIADMTLDSDEEELDSDLDEGMFIEDEDDDEDEEPDIPLSLGYYAANNNRWSSDEDEEEEEFDYTTALPSDEDGNISDDSEEDKQVNPFLPLLDSEGNIYDSIAAAFMQSFAPISTDTGGDTTNGINTPALGEEYQLSPFELAQALNALSAETSRQHNQDFLRRPSLPSNAVSAAQRHRGSQDFNTSEALRALSVLVTDDLSLAPLQPIHEDLEMESLNDTPPMQSPIDNSSPPSTNDQIQDAINESIENNKKRGLLNEEDSGGHSKKRRISRSNSLNQDSVAVSMDDLVDTSQLYTRSLSRSPSPEVEDDPYSRDLSRWQRIPIGAFRLMRSRNKLWLER
ncbi:uncharacterized protein EV154DRAFT_409897 [Mucor mucedo]|uniref:uncharacterized protein n=1 Tax=Mucor mucedo TaxID=29922 RepID=UPI0022204764|nr:uncharacterized protein EV154DRAFT_409897 [Mucor mucedo]KAI7897213.1 hypothetical protein EV154DRAFT_409897 [Mucor mucedo]